MRKSKNFSRTTPSESTYSIAGGWAKMSTTCRLASSTVPAWRSMTLWHGRWRGVAPPSKIDNSEPLLRAGIFRLPPYGSGAYQRLSGEVCRASPEAPKV